MLTAKAPAATRAQAARMICARLPAPLTYQTRVTAAGTEVLCDLLIALEHRFDIDLDVAEVWPAATVGDLINLVEVKVNDKAGVGLLPANDLLPPRGSCPEGAEGGSAQTVVAFPAEPAPFVWRRPIVHAIPPRRPSAANADPAEARRLIRQGLRLCLGCAGLALVLHFALGGR